MAIDMIEKGELHATSRLGGTRRFIDDKFVNYTGDDDFFNLFGSRKKKKTKARMVIVNKYDKYQNLTDCNQIRKVIDIVTSDLETLVNRSGGKPKLEIREQIDETQAYLGNFKSLLIKYDCDKIEAEKEAEKTKQDTLNILTSIGESQVEASKKDIAAASVKGSGIADVVSGLFGGGSGDGKKGIEATPDEGGAAPDKKSKTNKVLLYGGIGVAAVILVAVIVKLSRK